jgi:hypothetical protein
MENWKKIDLIKINGNLGKFTGKIKTHRIKTRLSAKSNFSMLNLLRAIVNLWNERLIMI